MAENMFGTYLSLEECFDEGIHLTETDDDGFCIYCGEQEPEPGAWDNEDD